MMICKIVCSWARVVSSHTWIRRAAGYEEYLAVLADPEDEEHGNMLQWRGPFDPEAFEPVQVNQGLGKKSRARKMATSSSPR
jgi:hypothetical protein